MKHNAIVPSILKDDEDNEYLVIHNGQGTLLNVEKMEFIASQLLKTIELSGLGQFIEEENKENYIRNLFSCDKETKGKYLIPFDRLNIKRKKFNPDKVWGCKCGNCSKKMSSKDGGEYFTINPSRIFEEISERACSEGCMKVIAKELIINWIVSNSYQQYFDLDKLDGKLLVYIADL
jgi:hypothetical protein